MPMLMLMAMRNAGRIISVDEGKSSATDMPVAVHLTTSLARTMEARALDIERQNELKAKQVAFLQKLARAHSERTGQPLDRSLAFVKRIAISAQPARALNAGVVGSLRRYG